MCCSRFEEYENVGDGHGKTKLERSECKFLIFLFSRVKSCISGDHDGDMAARLFQVMHVAEEIWT